MLAGENIEINENYGLISHQMGRGVTSQPELSMMKTATFEVTDQIAPHHKSSHDSIKSMRHSVSIIEKAESSDSIRSEVEET